MADYDWDSTDYERYSSAQQKWARELIAVLSLAGSEDLLDIGCGDGKVTAEIAALLSEGSVVGIDSSKSMIELAGQRYPTESHPNLTFSLMDAADLRFRNRFDVVFSNAALHWIKDHRPVIEGIYCCLKPGGRMLLQMGGKGNARVIIEVLDDIIVEHQYQSHFQDFEFPYGFLGIDQYCSLLEGAGFINSRVELIDKDMIHDGRDGLTGWLRTTWLPYTQRLPESQRDGFIDSLAVNYLERVPLDAQGKSHVDMVRLQVDARKPAENIQEEGIRKNE